MDLDKFFGDSYDIVKQSLLRWLKPCGAWQAHPMFTVSDPPRADEFARLLRVPLVSTESIGERRGRAKFMDQAKACQSHLFLDPDTGLRMPPGGATKRHVTGQELVGIAIARPDKLTLVFDQSLDRRRKAREEIKEKLSCLRKQGVHGLAYESHACFVLVSASRDVLDRAERTLLRESRLPPDRLVRG